MGEPPYSAKTSAPAARRRLVLRNGKLITVNARFDIAQAMAIDARAHHRGRL